MFVQNLRMSATFKYKIQWSDQAFFMDHMNANIIAKQFFENQK